MTNAYRVNKYEKGEKASNQRKKNLFVNFGSLCAFRLLSWIYGCHQKEGKFWQRIYVNKKCKQTSYTKLIDINNKPQEDRRLIVTQLLSDKTLDFFV